MKTPTARKLPSGSWFVRVQINGESIPITRETKKEAEKAAMALKSGAKAAARKSGTTVRDAITKYISDREPVLSPSTIRGYRKIHSLRFQSMMDMDIASVTQAQWQRAVSIESKSVSAKTLKNAWGFLSSVIADSTGQHISVRLPQVISHEAAYLSSSDMRKFLDALRGNPYEIGILLGLSGLRRSEILNVRWSDIDLKSGCIYVNGSAVQDEHNDLIRKATNKNTTSHRRVPFILPQLRAAVEAADKSGEYAVSCYPNTLNVVTQRICRQAGLPKCTCHGLRKSFASFMLVDLHMPEDIVMQAGGWSDPSVMRKIYSQVSTENLDKAGAEMEKLFSNF